MSFFNFDSIKNMERLLLKKQMMLKNCQETKTVIFGGSSVLYGFNTEFLTEAFHQPTYNLGVNVGLGFRYAMDYFEPHLNPGDHVILPLEFNQYTNPPYYVFGFAIDTFLRRRIWMTRKNYHQKGKLLLISLKHAKTSATAEKMKRRQAAELAESGCYLGLSGQIRNPETLKQIPFPREFQETLTAVEIINFRQRLMFQGIKTTLLPPVFFANQTNEVYLDRLYQALNMPYDTNLFRLKKEEVYDSVYHANALGQDRVTNALLEILEIRRGR